MIREITCEKFQKAIKYWVFFVKLFLVQVIEIFWKIVFFWINSNDYDNIMISTSSFFFSLSFFLTFGCSSFFFSRAEHVDFWDTLIHMHIYSTQYTVHTQAHPRNKWSRTNKKQRANATKTSIEIIFILRELDDMWANERASGQVSERVSVG